MLSHKVLFFGELPNTIIHGVSLSNQRILSVLRDIYFVDVISDDSKFDSSSFLNQLKRHTSVFFKMIKKISNRYKIFYLTCPLSSFSQIKFILLVMLFKLLNPNSLVVSHLHRADLKEFCSSRFNFFLLKTFLQLIDHLLVLSEYNVNCLNELGIEVNSKIIPNTVTGEVDFTLSINEKSGVVCLNNFIETKGYRDLFNSIKFSRVNYFHNFKFYGAVSDRQLYNYLKKLNFQNVSINNTIKNDEKFSVIASSRFLIMPSLNEGMPLVILEALSVGTPVICFDVGCISDYLGEDYPGLVKKASYSDFVVKINYLMSLSNQDYNELCNYSHHLYWSSFSNYLINMHTKNFFIGLNYE